MAAITKRSLDHRGPADLALLSAGETEDASLVVVGKRGLGLVFAHRVAGLPSELPPASVDRFSDRARFMVEGHVEAAVLAGRSAKAEVAIEDPRRFIERIARDHGAQMIVLGAVGEGPIGGLLVGTVVHYVAQFASLPVIIVR